MKVFLQITHLQTVIPRHAVSVVNSRKQEKVNTAVEYCEKY